VTEPVFPSVAQPPMREGHVLPTTDVTAIVDNRTELPDAIVREVIRDRWTELAGLQFSQPSNFALFATNQGSMLARTPFRTPSNVIDEIRLARSVADTDDDIGAIIGNMNAIAFGDGVVNQHRDENTLEFFNQITAPTGMSLEGVLEEMYRELLIAAQVTTLTLFARKRMQYWPLKSSEPVRAQLQVPNVAVLPAENLRVVTNDIFGQGQLAFHVEDQNLKLWLNEYLDPRTSGFRKALMAQQEPVAAALFTGKYVVPYNDGDPMSRGLTLYTLNQSMVKRTTLPKGAQPYPRPLLTRNFALLEAKRLLNIMDYCVGLDAEILTREGWKRHDEVKVGDETLGYDEASGTTRWTPILDVHHGRGEVRRMGNYYWGATCTAAHRWLTVRGHKVAAELGWADHLLLAAPYSGGDKDVTPDEARLVGWLHTDGNIYRGPRGRTFDARISQTKAMQRKEIAALLDRLEMPYSQRRASRDGNWTYQLAAEPMRKLWKRLKLETTPLETWLLGLSQEAISAFLDACWLADGTLNHGGSGAHQRVFACIREDPFYEVLCLATWLTGHRAGRRCNGVSECAATISARSINLGQAAVQDVWCVRTQLGSWTMRGREGIVLTGNSLLMGGSQYIVIAKKGTDNLPAQQGEVDNLVDQVRHASRSGVLVGDHRLSIEIITPQLTELLNPHKRMLIGRKLKMGLMRQTEEVPSDTGTQGGVNEMELTARVISADRRKLIAHAQATFYDDTANRNRSVFPMGAPSIWAPKLILSNVAQFWQNLLQARDRGDIPRRWVVEALGYDYDAALAERERELARGDDEILTPGAVPFSNPGEPQDNGPGRPQGQSSNNGRSQDQPLPARARSRQVIQRNAGETITAFVQDGQVHYVGELTSAVLEDYGERADYGGYVTSAERDAIAADQVLRSGPSVIVAVNCGQRCDEFSCVKLDDGLRMIVGRRIGDGAMIARALRFTEPHFDLAAASEHAIRWGFDSAPLTEPPPPTQEQLT
jgi:hypothetical protein